MPEAPQDFSTMIGCRCNEINGEIMIKESQITEKDQIQKFRRGTEIPIIIKVLYFLLNKIATFILQILAPIFYLY